MLLGWLVVALVVFGGYGLYTLFATGVEQTKNPSQAEKKEFREKAIQRFGVVDVQAAKVSADAYVKEKHAGFVGIDPVSSSTDCCVVFTYLRSESDAQSTQDLTEPTQLKIYVEKETHRILREELK